MRSLPAVVRDFHPQGRDEQEDQEQQRANTKIVPKEIPVPLRRDEPEPVQERGQVGQPVQGEKERMQEYQPEGGYAEPFMHLVNLVQAVKISFQQPVALLSADHEAEAWVNRAGGWANRGGGSAGWANRGGGSAGWVNRGGGSAGWANRGGGSAGWANRGGSWVNRY